MTDSGGGSDHADPAEIGRNGFFNPAGSGAGWGVGLDNAFRPAEFCPGGRLGQGIPVGHAGGTAEIPQSEAAAIEAATLLTDRPDVALAPQVLLGAETHDK